MRPSHPFTYFCFFLTQLQGQILLFQTFLRQYLMNTVHYLERQFYTFSHFRIHLLTTSL